MLRFTDVNKLDKINIYYLWNMKKPAINTLSYNHLDHNTHPDHHTYNRHTPS